MSGIIQLILMLIIILSASSVIQNQSTVAKSNVLQQSVNFFIVHLSYNPENLKSWPTKDCYIFPPTLLLPGTGDSMLDWANKYYRGGGGVGDASFIIIQHM
jgi:hypothetical protein